MKYLSVEEAIDMPGLRLVLTAGVPGPWGESAKAILAYKQLDIHTGVPAGRWRECSAAAVDRANLGPRRRLRRPAACLSLA